MNRRHLYLTAIACSAAFILLAIFPWRGFDPTGHWHRVGWIPFVSRPVSVVDMVGNLLLFVPLGVFVALHARRPALLRTSAVAFAFSFIGEWAQVYSRYRYPSTGDLILNVAGALIAAYGTDLLRRRGPGKVENPEVRVTFRASAPPALINDRGHARVD